MTTQGANYASNFFTLNAGSVDWANITNAGADDSSYATVTTTSNSFSDVLVCQNFGFSVPSSATINGLELEACGKQSYPAAFFDAQVGYENDEGISDNLAEGNSLIYGVSDTIVFYGGETELWGQTWTPEQVNRSTSQVYFAVQKVSGSTSRTFSLNYIRATVYYTESGGSEVLNQSRIGLLRAGR